MQEEPFSLKTPNAIDVLGARRRWNLTSLAQIGSQNSGSVWESENTAGLVISTPPLAGTCSFYLLPRRIASKFSSPAHTWPTELFPGVVKEE